jgi:hypothetical protein
VAGASVASGAAGSVAAGSSGAAVGAAPPQAARAMLASTRSDIKKYRLRFIFLLQENRSQYCPAHGSANYFVARTSFPFEQKALYGFIQTSLHFQLTLSYH